jgi:hypothetical protein
LVKYGKLNQVIGKICQFYKKRKEKGEEKRWKTKAGYSSATETATF